MKTKLFSALLLVAFIPGTALAERPTVTSVKQQLVLVMGMVQDLTEQLDRTRTELSITRAELAQVKGNTVLGLDGLLQLTQDSNGLDTAVFRGVNLQVVNGNGVTDSRNGLGNIVIGYNNSSEVFIDRFGSHNIILGDEQAYPNTQEVITEKILSNRDLAVIVANDMDMLIGANQATTIGKNRAVSTGGDQNLTVGGNESISVGVDRDVAIGANQVESIGGTANMMVGGDVSLSSGGNVSMNIGKELVVNATDDLLFKSGKALGTFNKNGDIEIQGKDILIKASGDLVLKGARILEN